MTTAIVALTSKGRVTANKIKETFSEATLFLAERVADGSEDRIIEVAFSELMSELFETYQQIICICAIGIVVRSIAPHLKHKSVDPAVVVVDDGGKYVISLISGHLGGANELAQKLATVLDGQAVITTASDNLSILSAEVWGKEFNLLTENFSALPAVNAAIVNNEQIAVISDWAVPTEARKIGYKDSTNYYARQDFRDSLADPKYNGYIYITDTILTNPLQPHIVLRPKTLSLGIGVRRGISKEVISEVVQQALMQAGVSEKSLYGIASIDAKQDEKGLLELAEDLKVPINFFNKAKLQTIISAKGLNISCFVEKQMGVGAVCEPAALAIAENSTLILNKYQAQGVTVAIARVPFTW